MNVEELQFLKKFSLLVKKEKRRLPYHLNLIDELHINENGHSRILYKLLSFCNQEDNYEILESLIQYIIVNCKKKSFEQIHISKPNISQEKQRIDLWIRDSTYAIIFENKIYNAQDQEAQISRYIECTLEKGYLERNIYVVYLPPVYGKEPADQSWGKYKNSFKDRYVCLSFREYILPWLENEILPNIRQKDAFLKSAIDQYIDYLRGLFMIRKINDLMNMNLQNLLSEHYQLDKCSNATECLSVLNEKLSDIDELTKQIYLLKDEIRKQYFEDFKQKIKAQYNSNYELYMKSPVSQNKYYYAGLHFMFEGEVIEIIIGEENGSMYCWLGRDNSSIIEKFKSRYPKISDILVKYNDNWMGKDYPIDDCEGVCSCFKKVVDIFA